MKWNKYNTFREVPFFRATRDGRHVIALNIYPGLHKGALTLLDCPDNAKSINQAIARWGADALEEAAADAGIIIAKVRSTEELFQEQQYQQVLQHMPLISVEKIAEGNLQPLAATAHRQHCRPPTETTILSRVAAVSQGTTSVLRRTPSAESPWSPIHWRREA